MKTFLTDVLSADPSHILQHVDEQKLVTLREYRKLQIFSKSAPEDSNIRLLDTLISKDGQQRHSSGTQQPHTLSQPLPPQSTAQAQPQVQTFQLPSKDVDHLGGKTMRKKHSLWIHLWCFSVEDGGLGGDTLKQFYSKRIGRWTFSFWNQSN